MKAAIGREVYQWPEFKALCARLGIPLELRTTHMAIEITHDDVVRVRHEYQGQQVPDVPQVVDTTTLHNERFRTKQPIRPES